MKMSSEQIAKYDALIQDLTKRGKLIEAGFIGFRAAVISPDAPQVQVDEMRMAFMVGAQHLFASVMTVLDDGDEPTENDLKNMALISKELDDFYAQITPLHGATGRAQ